MNIILSYIPLLLTSKIDTDIIMKIFGMLLIYALTNTEFITFITEKLKFNYGKKHKYTHIISYVYGYDGCRIQGEATIDYIIVSEYIYKILKENKNITYTTFTEYDGKIYIESVENIEIEKNINIIVNKKECGSQESNLRGSSSNKLFKNTIELSTHEYGSIIDEFLKKLKTQYLITLENNKIKNMTRFIYDINKVDLSKRTIDYDRNLFETTKSFNNLFFDQKQELLQRLDYFINNKNNYYNLGIPYTFGILLHGIPGSGKTSIIKAVAKYTDRDIIKINISEIKTIQELKYIFSTLPGQTPYFLSNKSILVFEEIDCGEWADIVRSRDLPPLPKKMQYCYSQYNVDDENDKQDITKVSPASNYYPRSIITLGDILEYLDGIIEYSGRIIIMTSNKPETLDSALLRPGRIDLRIELNKLSRENVNNLYKLWFGSDIPKNIYSNMFDYQFTQADIGLLFSKIDKPIIHNELLN